MQQDIGSVSMIQVEVAAELIVAGVLAGGATGAVVIHLLVLTTLGICCSYYLACHYQLGFMTRTVPIENFLFIYTLFID